MKTFFLMLLILPKLLCAWYSKEELLKKIESPPPEWMMRQIREDLSPFIESGVNWDLFNKTYEVCKVPSGGVIGYLQQFSIRNNVVKASDHTWKHWRVERIRDFLNELAKNVALPDIDFIYCVWDMYENPTFLELTQCPVFTICKYRDNRKAVLVPEVSWPFPKDRQGDVYDIKKMNAVRPWKQRKDFAFWRGATNDVAYFEKAWDYRPRARLILFSLTHPNLVNARYIPWNTKTSQKLHDYFDELGFIVDRYPLPLWTTFKYLIAVDGISYPSAFYGELFSGSTVLKQESEFVEWFYQALQPYVHYVPFQMDCCDLEDKILWLRANPSEAKAIARNAFDFADNNLQAEDIMLYYYLALKEYAKLWRGGNS